MAGFESVSISGDGQFCCTPRFSEHFKHGYSQVSNIFVLSSGRRDHMDLKSLKKPICEDTEQGRPRNFELRFDKSDICCQETKYSFSRFRKALWPEVPTSARNS
ncbi:hypothetical protein AVEN_236946-1 [Araneus ventricosus]|uniref:Uncharacterized protein n=1 Tax=Araneus ventricosus TaxID=182803 RepID=A0A4Y2LGR9_ARAVE|nr:hypothetical protein AVEN_236946-1 [Araneus ventricosus]